MRRVLYLAIITMMSTAERSMMPNKAVIAIPKILGEENAPYRLPLFDNMARDKETSK